MAEQNSHMKRQALEKRKFLEDIKVYNMRPQLYIVLLCLQRKGYRSSWPLELIKMIADYCDISVLNGPNGICKYAFSTASADIYSALMYGEEQLEMRNKQISTICRMDHQIPWLLEGRQYQQVYKYWPRLTGEPYKREVDFRYEEYILVRPIQDADDMTYKIDAIIPPWERDVEEEDTTLNFDDLQPLAPAALEKAKALAGRVVDTLLSHMKCADFEDDDFDDYKDDEKQAKLEKRLQHFLQDSTNCIWKKEEAEERVLSTQTHCKVQPSLKYNIPDEVKKQKIAEYRAHQDAAEEKYDKFFRLLQQKQPEQGSVEHFLQLHMHNLDSHGTLRLLVCSAKRWSLDLPWNFSLDKKVKDWYMAGCEKKNGDGHYREDCDDSQCVNYHTGRDGLWYGWSMHDVRCVLCNGEVIKCECM